MILEHRARSSYWPQNKAKSPPSAKSLSVSNHQKFCWACPSSGVGKPGAQLLCGTWVKSPEPSKEGRFTGGFLEELLDKNRQEFS